MSCPEDYHYFRGSCYHYIQWVLRHYEDRYNFQTKWQTSQDHCEQQGAMLVSIKDEEEAYYIKVGMLVLEWMEK